MSEITKFGLKFANPFTAASGTFGYGDCYTDFYNPDEYGAIVLKSVSLNKRIGNPPQRIIETPAGLLNSIGLENIGLDKLIQTKIPFLETIHTNVIASLYAEKTAEFVKLIEKFNGINRIDAIEINVSCPNVKAGGMAFGNSCEMTELLVKEVKKAAVKPLIVKLSPNITDIGEIAKAAEASGADAVSLINTISAMVIDTDRMIPILANKFGGLSGPAILPIAIRMVYQVYEAVSIPIIGGGGITSIDAALQFVMAGASLLSIGTYNFVSPASIPALIKRFDEKIKGTGYAYKDIIGIAHR